MAISNKIKKLARRWWELNTNGLGGIDWLSKREMEKIEETLKEKYKVEKSCKFLWDIQDYI